MDQEEVIARARRDFHFLQDRVLDVMFYGSIPYIRASSPKNTHVPQDDGTYGANGKRDVSALST